MAILAGMHPSKSYNACKPTTLHGLDNCWFIWKNFSNAGYVTAYGEDYPSISTFNYRKKGFYNQPTDYYLRPFILVSYYCLYNFIKVIKVIINNFRQ